MHKWRDERWDHFCLVTPNWQCQLPGHAYDGADPHGFMVKDEILAYLDALRAQGRRARASRASRCSRSRSIGDGFRDRDQRRALHGGRGVSRDQPLRRAVSAALRRSAFPNSIVQVHSADYRSAAALPEGAVVVVGSGQSGAQIAEDLHLAGRKVHLVTGNAPRCARFYRGRDVVDWLWDIGQYEITVADDGMGRKRHDTNHYLTGRDGGRDIDLRAFALQGMALYGRLDDVRAGRMIFEPNLAANLDDADRVYNGINALIDRHIADKGIEAPPASVYSPVWAPDVEPAELDLAEAGVTRSSGRPASRRTGRMRGCRSSTAPAIRSIAAASRA